MIQPMNPYEPGKEPNATSESVRDQDPALLHRGLGALIGSIYGGCSVAFFAFVFLATAIKSGFIDRFDIGGPYVEIGLFYLPLCALPSGIAGGLICGTTRASRLWISISVSLVIPLLFLASAAVISSNRVDAIFIASVLLLSSIAGLLVCHVLVASIVRKRRVAFETIKSDSNASPGLFGMLLNVSFTVGLFTLVLSLESVPEYFVGLMLAAAIFGTLTSLYLLAAYPNHFRTGFATATASVITVVFLLVLHVDAWT